MKSLSYREPLIVRTIRTVNKRAEPVWKTLELGISARWIRPVTYWYMSAPTFRQTVARESIQAQLALE